MRRKAIAAIACLLSLAIMSTPALAAENGMLAAVAGGKLVTLNADGTGLRTLWNPPGEVTQLAWSPTGSKLALIMGGKLVVLDAARTTTPLTLPDEGLRYADPAWLGDETIGFRQIGPSGQSRRTVKADLSGATTPET